MMDDACSWDSPGRNPYTGTTEAAIMAMGHIPEPARRVLIAKVAQNRFDDHVTITRDNISGEGVYRAELSFMAFGTGRVCKTVTRSKWDPNLEHRALVYCVDRWCIARPSVCNNWSSIERMQQHRIEVVTKPAELPVTLPGWQGGKVNKTNEIPEPSTLWLALFAVLAIVLGPRIIRKDAE